MIQPTKGISVDRALLTVGAQVLQQLDTPATVTAAWHSLKDWRRRASYPSNMPYSWFVLSLDVLYALDVLSYENGLLVKRSIDAPSTS